MINNLYFSSNISESLFADIKAEVATVGYYNLPAQNLDYLDQYYHQFDKRYDLELLTDIVVIGIGGSALGAKAIYSFLEPTSKFERKLHFIESTDPLAIFKICNEVQLDSPSTHFVIISKSGKTIETIAGYKQISHQVSKRKDSYPPFTFVTEKNTALDKHAQAIGAQVLYIPENVGGRFSALSAVGLVPLLLVGADIKKILCGAETMRKGFFSQTTMQQNLLTKATHYFNHSGRLNTNIVFSYSESLHYFNEWFVQLWGESLGKKQRSSTNDIGPTPVGIIGPKDQHSFLQLLAEGPCNKTVTFVRIANHHEKELISPAPMPHLEHFDLLSKFSFSELINLQAESTIEVLLNNTNLAIDEITIDAQNEETIGGLLYYYQILTSLMGILLDVNTYDQPGVEAGKIILMNKLKAKK